MPLSGRFDPDQLEYRNNNDNSNNQHRNLDIRNNACNCPRYEFNVIKF